MEKRGQSAVELMIVMGALLFFFIFFFAAIQKQKGLEFDKKESLFLNNLALSIKDEIYLARESSPGYYREFNTPKIVLGTEYSLAIVEGHIQLNTSDNAVTYKIVNVSGNILKGLNFIRNENGTVYLNQ